jgi:hypothetical protein
MKKKCVYAFITVLSAISLYGYGSVYYEFFLTNHIDNLNIDRMPAPANFGNYYIFQSLDDVSSIIIGDLSTGDGSVNVITDSDNDGKINVVYEYSFETKIISRPAKPSTDLYTELTDMKRKIIEGKVFEDRLTMSMSSLVTLKAAMKDPRNIYPMENGYRVKVYDSDNQNLVRSEFYFAKKSDRYDLIFLTHYFNVMNKRVIPPITVSVACKNTKDPVVAKYVEDLFVMVKKEIEAWQKAEKEKAELEKKEKEKEEKQRKEMLKEEYEKRKEAGKK